MNKKILPIVLGLFVFGLAVLFIYLKVEWHTSFIARIFTRTSATEHMEQRSVMPLTQLFLKKGIPFPPEKLALLVIKEERVLELWAWHHGQWAKIKSMKMTAFSGKLGPKLREGDRQIPEGIYKIVGLNPQSAYHLSMKLNYPNAFDQYWATKEGRAYPGSNIFIHGKAVSIGCIAVGDPAIEELFYLVRDTGMAKVQVVIAPRDPRKYTLRAAPNAPAWVHTLYQNIQREFLLISAA